MSFHSSKPTINRVSIFIVVGAIAFTFAACTPSPKTGESPKIDSKTANTETAKTNVLVTDKGCEPAEITVNAGKNTFTIDNKSAIPLEWEILDGVKVIDERENIAPGFVQNLTTNLAVGEYTLICGKKSGAKGKLTVKATATSTTKESEKSASIPKHLEKPIAKYKVYIQSEVDQLVKKTKTFTDAVIAGDLGTAQKLYPSTRVHWERSEPIAELFSDLDKSIDARADDFAKKEDDPTFTGFHRIEKALFQDKSTAGMKPIAEKLMKDLLDLQKRIATLDIEPKNMVGGAAELIEEVAATKISGEEDRYSRTDLWDFKANIEGAEKIVDLLHPEIEKADPKLHQEIGEGFSKINTTLAKYKTPDGGFESYEKLSDEDRKNLKTIITAQAEALSKLRGTLGVD
jgi:iron uptake system component EfeO